MPELLVQAIKFRDFMNTRVVVTINPVAA